MENYQIQNVGDTSNKSDKSHYINENQGQGQVVTQESNSTTNANSNPANSSVQPEPTGQTQSSKKNPNDLSPEEQAKYYKDLFSRSKKLILHYEENLKTKDNTIKSLKDKLKDYEAGIFKIKKQNYIN